MKRRLAKPRNRLTSILRPRKLLRQPKQPRVLVLLKMQNLKRSKLSSLLQLQPQSQPQPLPFKLPHLCKLIPSLKKLRLMRRLKPKNRRPNKRKRKSRLKPRKKRPSRRLRRRQTRPQPSLKRKKSRLRPRKLKVRKLSRKPKLRRLKK